MKRKESEIQTRRQGYAALAAGYLIIFIMVALAIVKIYHDRRATAPSGCTPIPITIEISDPKKLEHKCVDGSDTFKFGYKINGYRCMVKTGGKKEIDISGLEATCIKLPKENP